MFGEPHRVFKAASTLVRLVQLDNALPKNKTRTKTIGDLAQLWIQANEQLTGSLDVEKKVVSEKLKTANNRIYLVYANDIEAAKTFPELKKCRERFLKDVKSIQINPIQKTHKGLNGPTYLVSYPRLKVNGDMPKLQNYVIKWTHWDEICSTRLYAALSECLQMSKELKFTVPSAAALDFDAMIHETTEGSHQLLSEESNQALKIKFEALLKTMDPKLTPSEQQIMLMERVPGANLFDFAMRVYPTLGHEQKVSLFRQLGFLAILDLVTGNSDRLIRVIYDEKSSSFNLETFEANLGNAMVVYNAAESVFPSIVAIDNRIDANLINDLAQSEKYNQFLRELFDNPKMIDSLGEAMLISIQSAVNLQIEDEDDPIEAKKGLQQFSQDLKTIALPAMKEGLAQMASKLKGSISTFWEQEQNAPLKNHLNWAHPEFLRAVDERFKIFTKKA